MTKKDDERRRLVNEACADEISRFNESVRRTPIKINEPDSLANGRTVAYMGHNFDLVTGSGMFQATWAYCNDGRWARLLAQAGVTRNPLFA